MHVLTPSRWRGAARGIVAVVVGLVAVATPIATSQAPAAADANHTHCARVDRSCCVERVLAPRRESYYPYGSFIHVVARITCSGTASIIGGTLEAQVLNRQGEVLTTHEIPLGYDETYQTVTATYFCTTNGRYRRIHGGLLADYSWRNSQIRERVYLDDLFTQDWSGYC